MVARAGDGFLSPFLMHKVLKQAAGEIEKITQISQFKYLIKTKSMTQAEKLLKVKMLGDRELIIEEHPFLNKCRGVVRCHTFSYMEDVTIIEEFADQKVVAIERMLTRGKPSEIKKRG